VLFGAGQSHLVAVISPRGEVDAATITAHIAWVNAQVGDHERIASVIVAEPAFSNDNGLLTSQGKPRRNWIKEAYDVKIRRAHGEQP
jgi:hypothetical protein